jgi:hypothetical protein
MIKKILIVSSSFYPEQSPRAFRVTELAKEFSKKGHDVHVLTPITVEAIMLGNEYSFTIHDLEKNPFKKIKFNSQNRIHFLIERLIFRSLNFLFEFPDIGFYFLTKSKLRFYDDFDLLISNAVPFPVHWGVASVWKNKKAAKVWVADCGDPYMGLTSDTFPKAFYFHYFENKFLKVADYISIPFEDLKFRFNKKYHNKFVSIPQGFNFDDLNLKEYIKNDILRIAYAGHIIPGFRHPYELINFLRKQGVPFEFFFFGTEIVTFKKESEIGSEIIFVEKIPRIELIYELSQFDFLVNINEREVDGRTIAVPSKLIDYQLSKRPILNYVYGNLNEKIVDEFLNENYSGRYIDLDFERFNIKNVADSFLKLPNL